ncbi:hypothetical protein [Marinobacter similis]|uniref:Uncharacterized protein n=1 Tax=Marinobacter similis TaxID=1420916 RepID=W5YLL2_9GAMM|nr:hypothetical protein [Marinobacter similis]AHI29961.1 hypothetical protein AU14_02570 [Marinobacter similis]
MDKNQKANGLQTTLIAALTSAALLASGVATAEDSLSAEAISAAVSDHSYQGSMSSPNSGFNEYYAPDGTIYGKDYEGKWTTQEGKMCFAYGDEQLATKSVLTGHPWCCGRMVRSKATAC